MYTHYFGFKERPFKLVPNPDYLYLSHSHEEALAHLTYAVSEGDGFLTITGEVGTGKTTLCRSFIEKLDNRTVVAYIFNPKLDSVQLLKAINDEFEIPSNFDNTKDLIDVLNRFLIKTKQEEKQAVLLIDEAQNLNADVLEQLRLLSNLETTQEKLLQIILVGQPELFELLDSHELRQLAQRITLRRHLMPFSAREVKEYVIHRINLVSQKSHIKFTSGAFKAINNYSNGIPRLINIVCDRALLTAYGLNKKRITQGIVNSAIRELNTNGQAAPYGVFEIYKIPMLLSALLLALILMGIFHPDDILNIRPLISKSRAIPISVPQQAKPPGVENPDHDATDTTQVNTPDVIAKTALLPLDDTQKIMATEPPEPLNAPSIKPEIETPFADIVEMSAIDIQQQLAFVANPENSDDNIQSPKTLSLRDYFNTIDIGSSRGNSLQTVFGLWGIPNPLISDSNEILDDNQFFRLTAQKNGLTVQVIKNNFALAKRLNLPFIIEIYFPEKLSQVYLAVYRIDQNIIHLKTSPNDTGIALDLEELKPFIGEHAYILWKNFYGYTGIIPTSTSENSVITLKLHIREMGFPEIDISPYYDQSTREVVKNIQKKYRIAMDGRVGPITKIALYNETTSLSIPHILK